MIPYAEKIMTLQGPIDAIKSFLLTTSDSVKERTAES